MGWANQTWFRAEDKLFAEEIFTEGYYDGKLPLANGPVKIGDFLKAMSQIGISVPADAKEWWTALGLSDFNQNRVMTRLEAAVVIDETINPFNMFGVDYNGNVRR